MKERPILFSAPMVRTLLSGTKTQTRRVVKPRPSAELLQDYAEIRARNNIGRTDSQMLTECLPCPYGQPGGRLWVRETWAQGWTYGGETPCTFYRATGDGLQGGASYPRSFDPKLGATAPSGMKWKPGIHMPRWASRITLEVTAVRVERLQDISADDAWAEGIAYSPDADPVHDYKLLWESINGQGSWEANPFVWVVSFRRLDPS